MGSSKRCTRTRERRGPRVQRNRHSHSLQQTTRQYFVCVLGPDGTASLPWFLRWVYGGCEYVLWPIATVRMPLLLHFRIRPCPFDVRDKDVFGYVFGDKCGVVEDIAFNLSNTAIAYAGTSCVGALRVDRNSDIHFLEFQTSGMLRQVPERSVLRNRRCTVPHCHSPSWCLWLIR